MTFAHTYNKLKITLSLTESRRLFGGSEQLDKNSLATRLALKLLLKKAVCDMGFKLDGKSILAEISKNRYGGYDVYFSKNTYPAKQLNKASEQTVFEFSSCENVIKACRAIKRCRENISSSFYRMENGYRLILDDAVNLHTINEFADKTYSSQEEIYFTRKCGRLLIEQNAVLILQKL